MDSIFFIGNNDMGLYAFRFELIKTLRNNYEVYISVPSGEYSNRFRKIGCNVINIKLDRRSTNPLKDLVLLMEYFRLIKKIKPSMVLTYTIKPNIYGGIACRLSGVPYLPNITGLGTFIENGGWKQRLALFLYKQGTKNASCVFFQNKSNRDFMLDRDIVGSKNVLIPGSGVNLEYHESYEYPSRNNQIRFLFIGRIMRDKGIDELLYTAAEVKKANDDIFFDIIGFCEEEYSNTLSAMTKDGVIDYLGPQEDVRPFIRRCNAVILPSYHEGLANVLLESSATGRPVIASMIPGCQETFEDGVTGLGVKVKDREDLLQKVIQFIDMPYEQKAEMGRKARKKMEDEFDRQIVIDAYMEEISKVVDRGE